MKYVEFWNKKWLSETCAAFDNFIWNFDRLIYIILKKFKRRKYLTELFKFEFMKDKKSSAVFSVSY